MQANLIGQASQEASESIDLKRLQDLAHSVGMISLPAASTALLPTFLTCLRGGELEILQNIGIPTHRVLHGEQEYQLWIEMKAGDRIRYRTRISDAVCKKSISGVLNILTLETLFHHELTSKKVASSKSVFIIRGEI